MENNTDTHAFIADLDGGVFEQKLARALSLVAGSVVDHERAGKVTITLDIKRINSGCQVMVDHQLKYSHPTLRGSVTEEEKTSTPMHVGTGGAMSFFPEDQGQMFSKQGQPVKDPFEPR